MFPRLEELGFVVHGSLDSIFSGCNFPYKGTKKLKQRSHCRTWSRRCQTRSYTLLIAGPNFRDRRRRVFPKHHSLGGGWPLGSPFSMLAARLWNPKQISIWLRPSRTGAAGVIAIKSVEVGLFVLRVPCRIKADYQQPNETIPIAERRSRDNGGNLAALRASSLSLTAQIKSD